MSCGTNAGYAKHIAWRTRPCDECRDAHNQYRRDVYHHPRGRKRKTVRHGTYAGYQRHRTRGETPCDACRLARNEYQREWHRQNRAVGVATIPKTILDVLETQGSSMAWLSLSAWVNELHPEWRTDSVRRTLYRMVDDGRVVRVEFGDEVRYRLPEGD